MAPPFHLAFPVDDLDAARRFYGELLGCPTGRTDVRWVDFDFFGHQITAHLVERRAEAAPTNAVDGDPVPASHFGAILEWREWESLGQRLAARGVTFLLEPHVRFRGEVGEQGTFFVRDPAGNALEFKSFKDSSRIFATT